MRPCPGVTVAARYGSCWFCDLLECILTDILHALFCDVVMHVYVECYDSSISPQTECTTNGAMFTCSSSGHPNTADYTWTHWYWSHTDTAVTSTAVDTYSIADIGFHTVQCAATYFAPSYCPDYSAHCYSNITLRTFR